MPRTSLQIMLGITLVMAIFYFWKPADLMTPDQDTAERREELPQTYLYAIQHRAYDDQGQLADIMEAIQAEDYPNRRETWFTMPRVFTHDGNDRTWSAAADEGRLRHGSQKLYLRRNVALINDQTNMRLDTRAMTLDLKQKTAVSKVEVTVADGVSSIIAQGMEADLVTEQVVMKPDVESLYVPDSPRS